MDSKAPQDISHLPTGSPLLPPRRPHSPAPLAPATHADELPAYTVEGSEAYHDPTAPEKSSAPLVESPSPLNQFSHRVPPPFVEASGVERTGLLPVLPPPHRKSPSPVGPPPALKVKAAGPGASASALHSGGPTAAAKPLPSPRRLPPAFIVSPGEERLATPNLDAAVSRLSLNDPAAPDNFVRDPHKLIAYIVPFPEPVNLAKGVPRPPTRFLIYTPPPPPLLKPGEGEKEKVAVKMQRKWQDEVREAQCSEHKVASWRGVKSRVTKGVNWAMHKTTSADLDFINRIPRDGEKLRGSGASTPRPPAPAVEAEIPLVPSAPPAPPARPAQSLSSASEKAKLGQLYVQNPDDKPEATEEVPNPDLLTPATPAPDEPRKSLDHHADDGVHEDMTTNSTVRLNEMVLIYPPSLAMSPEELRVEFINNLMRTKSKAQRDAVIATGLLPVSAALDWALIFVGWVFGGLLEVDAVWAASSIRGAKTARSVTKRLSSTSSSGDAANSDDKLKLSFVSSHRADALSHYLTDQCVRLNIGMFSPARGQDGASIRPNEDEVLASIGWERSGVYEDTNWEDEAWERGQVKEDVRRTMEKAAKTWDKWVAGYERNPEKATKK